MEFFKLDHPRRIDVLIDYFGGGAEAGVSAEELDTLLDRRSSRDELVAAAVEERLALAGA